VGTGRRLREEMHAARTSGDRPVPRATRRSRFHRRARRHGECSGLNRRTATTRSAHAGRAEYYGSMGLRLMLPFF